MTRRFLTLLGLAWSLAWTVHAEEEWEVLFNGKDLSGWSSLTTKDAFSVVDGAIRAQAASDELMDHLFYVGERGKDLVRFKNFELQLMAKGELNANSGIFFHTDRKTRETRKFLDSGYEVQLNRNKTGSLYDVQDVSEPEVDPAKWFQFNLIVKDKRITVKIDGKQVLDYTEPEEVKRSEKRKGRVLRVEGGAIALQAHDAKSVFYFKDIRVKRLP